MVLEIRTAMALYISFPGTVASRLSLEKQPVLTTKGILFMKSLATLRSEIRRSSPWLNTTVTRS